MLRTGVLNALVDWEAKLALELLTQSSPRTSPCNRSETLSTENIKRSNIMANV